jgi:Predicted membrane protein, hemolysin III homolog
MPDNDPNGAAGNCMPKVAATLAPPEPASSSSGSTSASTKVRQRRPSFTESATAAAESLLHTAEATVEATLHQIGNLLWSWDDLPAWRRDNHFIRSGYRPTSYSVRACLASLGYLHNESVNIWTHLLGSAAFLLGGLLLYALVAPRYASASDSDVLVFACFLGGAFVCLGMSATFHTLSNHSPEVAMWGNKLDYTGIVFLIVGSYVPALYYGFFCHEYLMTFYLATVSLTSSTLSAGQAR